MKFFFSFMKGWLLLMANLKKEWLIESFEESILQELGTSSVSACSVKLVIHTSLFDYIHELLSIIYEC